jgi:hypothetical protein
MKRIAVYLMAIVFSLVAVFGTSCGGDDSVKLVFNQEAGSCAAVNQSAASIRCDGGVFAFEGSILTPNPCYYLKAGLDVVNQSNLEIVITATSQLGEDGYCVECVGRIAFDGTVELSNACSRSLSIVYNGAVIAEYERQ